MGREMYFSEDINVARMALSYAPAGLKESLRAEVEAINCPTCEDTACPHRNKTARKPADAGGKSQCLRWAKLKTGYCWRNGDGTVVIIPSEIVEAIRNDPNTD